MQLTTQRDAGITQHKQAVTFEDFHSPNEWPAGFDSEDAGR